MVEEATVTSKGQLTVPKSIREKLGLQSGTKVSFILRGRQAIMMPRSEDPLEDLKKMREEISFDEEEIRSMIQESKLKWSKFQ